MYVQIITFELDGISPAEFADLNDQVVPQYAGTPGLISKLFLADPDDEHAYGGVYLWESRQDADRYLADGLAQILVRSPQFAHVQARVMAVLPGPTSVTGGPLAQLAATG